MNAKTIIFHLLYPEPAKMQSISFSCLDTVQKFFVAAVQNE